MNPKRLEDLVADRELCKQLPSGSFEDSALIWVNASCIATIPEIPVWRVVLRSQCTPDCGIPAPLSEEILDALRLRGVYLPSVYFRERRAKHEWVSDGDIPAEIPETQTYRDSYGFTTATDAKKAANAALKLWFKVEGKDVG